MSSHAEAVAPNGYRIADLSIDLIRRQIHRNGEIVPCGKLTFDLLVLLARRAPGVVSREELADRLWAGRYVSPATVKRRVSLLRRALGEKSDHPRYLRSVRGHGYSLIPRVHALDPVSTRRVGWIRYGLAAAGLLLVFVFGAEIGYQDGLKPSIPDRQGTATIVVTSWPYDLSDDDYAFVMSAADRFMNVVHRSNFVGRLNRELPVDEAVHEDSLTVLARATNNDVEAIYVSLALLKDDRPDFRVSREQELVSWSRVLQDVRQPAVKAFNSTGALADAPASFRSTNYRSQVVPLGLIHDESFMLVANFRFDRNEMQTYPQEIQSEAVQSVAMTIEEEFAHWENAGRAYSTER
jgi:DNA-binding winged helix-turn-helix (wHTH) protein